MDGGGEEAVRPRGEEWQEHEAGVEVGVEDEEVKMAAMDECHTTRRQHRGSTLDPLEISSVTNSLVDYRSQNLKQKTFPRTISKVSRRLAKRRTLERKRKRKPVLMPHFCNP